MRVWVKLPMHIRRIPISVPRECVHIVKEQEIKKHATNKLENGSTRQVGDRCGRSSVFLLYWYKGTNTDASGVKVQILMHLLNVGDRCGRSSVCLLYWYKGTNTDAFTQCRRPLRQVLNLLALLVQRYKY
jgi:hypothetical protein